MPDMNTTADWQDHLCLVKMDWLTLFAKLILPTGHWGYHKPVADAQKFLYLTFDDGPHPDTTPALLELFDQEQVKATFFVLGDRAQRHPEMVSEILKRGHTIGNHSFSHKFMPALSNKMLRAEIDRTNEKIKEASGFSPSLFRPPYGLIDLRAAYLLRERKMKTVYWGAVSEDWMGIGEKRVVGRTMGRAKHGSLLVLHETERIAQQTISATREIIKQGKTKGYTFDAIRAE